MKSAKGENAEKGVKGHKTEGMEEECSNGPQPKTMAKYFTCGVSEFVVVRRLPRPTN